MDMPVQEQRSSFTASEQRFEFTGTGAEYFRIWIVNLFLTILTLGIFSAWAKVRRLQYFYRNTRIGDSSFDYHGSPIAILKGRLIGLALFATYSLTIQFTPLLGFFVALAIASIMPYLLASSFRFRLYNTSFRGLRFGFVGTVKDAYVVFLALPIATMFTMYLLAPFTHQRIKAYQHNNSRFGQSAFSFKASEGNFYLIYLFAFLQYMAVITVFVIASIAAGIYFFGDYFKAAPNDPKSMAPIILAVVLAVYALAIISTLLVVPYFVARIQNLIWNNTQLGENRFSSSLTVKGLAWIYFSNFVLTILTLGLYKPFAAIRMARYRVEHMALLPAGDTEEFIASEQQKAGATGTETAEFFDIDIGF